MVADGWAKLFWFDKLFNFQFAFQLTGLYKAGMKKQLSQFHAELLKYFPLSYASTSGRNRPDFQGIIWDDSHKKQIVGIEPVTDWFTAFSTIDELAGKQKLQ